MTIENLSIFDMLSDDDEMKKRFAPQASTDWKWNMATDYPERKNGLKVFSCFACGGVARWAINLLAVTLSAVARLIRK